MEIAKGFRARGRYRGVVRAARAYLAGFGTTGSLLAGAALMFIVASALVAFRGWPHVATAPSPGEVVISSRPASSTGTPAARRLAFVAAAPAAGAASGGRAGAGAPGPGARGRGHGGRGHGQADRRGGRSARRRAPRRRWRRRPAGGSTGCGCGVTTPASPPTPVQKVTQTLGQATNTLGNVVSDTGGKVGTVVQQTTNTAAGAVGGVSPAAGGAVKGAGSGDLADGHRRDQGARRDRVGPRALNRAGQTAITGLPARRSYDGVNPTDRSMNRRLTACSSASCWIDRWWPPGSAISRLRGDLQHGRELARVLDRNLLVALGVEQQHRNLERARRRGWTSCAARNSSSAGGRRSNVNRPLARPRRRPSPLAGQIATTAAAFAAAADTSAR